MSKITNQSTVSASFTLPDYTKKSLTAQSNISETENMTTSFTKVKSCERTHVVAKEEVEIKLVLQNDSAFDIENVKISDTFGDDAEFVAGSVEIDGVSQPTFDIQSSITLPSTIEAGNGSTIKYLMKIADEPQTTSATCVSDITYEVNGTQLSEKSNQVDLTIESIGVTIEKTSDKEAAIAGQEISFQNIIRNNGTVEATELFFQDFIPEGTSFVEGSVKIDSTEKADYNPATGFQLQDLAVGSQTIITFKVTVNA